MATLSISRLPNSPRITLTGTSRRSDALEYRFRRVGTSNWTKWYDSRGEARDGKTVTLSHIDYAHDWDCQIRFGTDISPIVRIPSPTLAHIGEVGAQYTILADWARDGNFAHAASNLSTDVILPMTWARGRNPARPVTGSIVAGTLSLTVDNRGDKYSPGISIPIQDVDGAKIQIWRNNSILWTGYVSGMLSSVDANSLIISGSGILSVLPNPLSRKTVRADTLLSAFQELQVWDPTQEYESLHRPKVLVPAATPAVLGITVSPRVQDVLEDIALVSDTWAVESTNGELGFITQSNTATAVSPSKPPRLEIKVNDYLAQSTLHIPVNDAYIGDISTERVGAPAGMWEPDDSKAPVLEKTAIRYSHPGVYTDKTVQISVLVPHLIFAPQGAVKAYDDTLKIYTATHSTEVVASVAMRLEFTVYDYAAYPTFHKFRKDKTHTVLVVPPDSWSVSPRKYNPGCGDWPWGWVRFQLFLKGSVEQGIYGDVTYSIIPTVRDKPVIDPNTSTISTTYPPTLAGNARTENYMLTLGVVADTDKTAKRRHSRTTPRVVREIQWDGNPEVEIGDTLQFPHAGNTITGQCLYVANTLTRGLQVQRKAIVATEAI